MTVQELINNLKKVEDKSAVVFIPNGETGDYDEIISVSQTTIPETFDPDDEENENVMQINALMLISI